MFTQLCTNQEAEEVATKDRAKMCVMLGIGGPVFSLAKRQSPVTNVLPWDVEESSRFWNADSGGAGLVCSGVMPRV